MIYGGHVQAQAPVPSKFQILKLAESGYHRQVQKSNGVAKVPCLPKTSLIVHSLRPLRCGLNVGYLRPISKHHRLLLPLCGCFTPVVCLEDSEPAASSNASSIWSYSSFVLRGL